MVIRNSEKLPNKLRPFSEVFLDELRAYYTQEGGTCLVRDCLCKKCLACSGLAVKHYTFRRSDADLFI